MKIVDVAESYSTQGGGVRTYMHHKFAAARAAGVDCVVVAPGTEDGEEEMDGGRIVWVKTPRSPFDNRYGLFNDERKVHAVLERENADVIEGSSPWNGGKYVASYHGRAKKSFVFHTDPVAVWAQTFFGRHLGFDRVDRMCAPMWKKIRALSDAYDTTVVSGGWLARRLRQFGIERTSVVDFGIDKQRFSPGHRDENLRRELLAKCGVPAHGKLIIAISRLDPEKRVATFIEGFAKASRHRPMGLVIFGRGALQKYYAHKANKTPGVHLHGYVSERDFVSRALASSDAFLHGSAAETYGLVVAEAVCSGVPVIVPDRGGAAALAGPDYAARYRSGDSSDCSEAILRLLARDRAQLARGCAAATEDIGTMDGHFYRLFELYGRMSGRTDFATPDSREVARVLPLRAAS